MKVVYIAHPLGAGPDREYNRKRATEYVVRAAEKGYAPIADWILLSGTWSEDMRVVGLAIDVTLLERCDEVWACGPRISEGMRIEIRHAFLRGIPVYRVDTDLRFKTRFLSPDDNPILPSLDDDEPPSNFAHTISEGD